MYFHWQFSPTKPQQVWQECELSTLMKEFEDVVHVLREKFPNNEALHEKEWFDTMKANLKNIITKRLQNGKESNSINNAKCFPLFPIVTAYNKVALNDSLTS